MARAVKLDKYIVAGTEYETDSRVAYIIERYGTDSTDAGYLEIDRKPTGEIDSTIAPMHKTSENHLGPLNLGDLYYVIPPETKFKFTGASGSHLRIIGKTLILEPGEKLGAPYITRYDRQWDHYLTLKTFTLTLGTDEVFKANEEKTLAEVRPPEEEEWRFNNFAGITASGDTIDYGDFALVIFEAGKRVEYLWTPNIGPGIDIKSMPLPPNAAYDELYFTFADWPFTAKHDHVVTFKIRNISGADKAPASGSAWSFTMKTIIEFIRK